MTANLESTITTLIDGLSAKYYGKYKGVVVDNEDPLHIARLKLSVPTVLGEDVVTGWALPCLPYAGEANQGFLFVPEVDSQVWVEFEEGNLQNPIWVGAYWSQPGGESELPKPNDMDGEEQDVQSPVTRKIIKTLKGHSIQLEDKDGEESILIIHRVDDSNSNILSMDSNGIKIVDQFKNIVEMKDSGIRLTDLTENQIEMSDSAFTITAKVALTIDASGQTVEVKGDSIDFTKA